MLRAYEDAERKRAKAQAKQQQLEAASKKLKGESKLSS